jgi:hypothetical protein
MVEMFKREREVLIVMIGNETNNAPDFHSEMENKLKMNW